MFHLDQLGTLTELESGRVWGPQNLRESIFQTRADLERSGVGPGSVVALVRSGGAKFFTELLALWDLKACVVPLDPDLPILELKRIVEHCGASHVLGRDLPVSGTSKSIPSGLILYTSGSTGRPKGVVHDLETVGARLTDLRRHIPAADLIHSLCLLPVHFGHGLIANSLLPLLFGDHLYVARPYDAALAGSLGTILDNHSITFMSSVPAVWELATRLSAPPQKQTLRRVHCASAPLSGMLRAKVSSWVGSGVPLTNVYGLTELASWISGATDTEGEAGGLGKGWGAEFRIQTDDGKQAAPGESGRIWIRSSSLMRGYLQEEELTRAKVQAGWLDSGDVGHLDAHGNLHLDGRSDSVINRAGFKVYPEEVERLIQEHPAIQDACAFGIEDELGGERIGVAIVVQSPIDVQTLEAWMRERTSRLKIPSEWTFLEVIPRSSRGKVSRSQVKAMCRKKPQ